MKLAFGVSLSVLETCFWCKLWGCINLLLVLLYRASITPENRYEAENLQ